MRLRDIKRTAKLSDNQCIVAAVDFLLRQLRSPKTGQFYKQAVEFRELLDRVPRVRKTNDENDLLSNGLAITKLLTFNNLWIDWCFDNKIDDNDLSQYK